MRRWMTAVAVLAYSALAAAEPVAAPAPPTGQLPRSAEPLHYRLDFDLDPRRDGFEGETRIRVRLHQPAAYVWLHARELEMKAVEWSAGTERGAAQFTQINADGLARVDFGRELPAQDMELHFTYSGRYSTRLESIYKVTRGADSYLVTQFQDIAARRAFPGFDEPSFKTPFEIRLTIPEKMKAVANTRQIGDERAESGSKALSFATTEALPTYLVAFAVGPWDMTKAQKLPANEVRSKPLALRALGVRGSKPQLAHALKTTPEILGELERYFGIPYPFDKLDLLAAPDFAYGAMENAGLITFRELFLLLDAKSPVDLQQDHYATNAHELAHQWFGNYVTLRWWDDIWLNEAFASWMQGKITERLHPEFRAGLDRLDATLGAMNSDSLVSARRIREPILETGDINLGFDAITYQKGAGVLNMFETWIGEEKFRDGIRLFMQRHARGTATSNDLIAALTEASGNAALAPSLRSFLDQPGVPRVDVRLQCGKQPPKLQLQQSRYLPLGSTGKQGARWQVPVCLKLGRGDSVQRQCFLLEQPKQEFALDACPDWVMPNEGGNGYYRYAMPAADLERLNARLDTLTPAEQRAHADSVHAGFRRGDLAPAALLQALPRFASSPLPAIATALIPDLNWLRESLADRASAEALRRYAIALYQPRLDRLGYAARAGESQDDALLRQQLADFLALDLNSAAAREGLRAAGLALWPQPWATRPPLEKANSALLGVTLAVLVQEGGEAVLNHLMDELRQNRDPEQRRALIEALGAVDDPVLAATVRDFSLDAGLQLRELAALYGAHKNRPANRAAFWTWAQAQYERVVAPYPSFAQNRIPGLLGSRMCSAQEATQLQQFLQPRLPGIAGGRRALDQALERIQLCTALRQRHAAKSLTQWVQQQALPAGPQTLAEAVASPLRSAAARSRDLYRHPQQTLEFFGLKPQQSVVEVWPGAGWYTEILAPLLLSRGHYTAAGFVDTPDATSFRRKLLADYRAKLQAQPDLYRGVQLAQLGAPDRWQPAPPRSADLVLTFRNVHNWMAGGYEKEMFKALAEMLRIGGSLGVVEHRAPPGTSIEDMKLSGYVTEEYVIQLAEQAGLQLHGRSEINANPNDHAQHPEGVWTLSPAMRLGDTDRAEYLAIGESDRMTLKFVKP